MRRSSKTGDTPWDLHSWAHPRMTGYTPTHTPTHTHPHAQACVYLWRHTSRVCLLALAECFSQTGVVGPGPCLTTDAPMFSSPYLAKQIQSGAGGAQGSTTWTRKIGSCCRNTPHSVSNNMVVFLSYFISNSRLK